MMTQEGQVNSFKELGEHFLDFVEKSNDTTDPWEVIDDRLDEFYGATIKFPVGGSIIKPPTDSSVFVRSFSVTESEKVGIIYPPYMLSAQVNGERQMQYPNTNNFLWGSVDSISPNYYAIQVIHKVLFDSILNSPKIYVDGFTKTSFGSSGDIDFMYLWYRPISSYGLKLDIFRDLFLNADYSTKAIEDASSVLDSSIDTFYIPVVLSTEMVFVYGLDLDALVGRIVDYINRLDNAIPWSHQIIPVIINYPNFALDFDSQGNMLSDSKDILDSMTDKLISTYPEFFYFKSDIPNNSYNDWTNYGEYSIKYRYLDTNCEHVFTSYHNYYLYTDMEGSGHELGKEIPIDPYINIEHGRSETISNRGFFFIGSNPFSADVQIDLISVYDKFPKEFSNYAYISLQYNKITSTTYNDWLTNTKDHYMSETFISDRLRPVWYANSLAYERTTISNQRQTDIANIFKNTGEVLFISPHIKYDKNLWMAEQGGIACDEETRNQAIEDNCIRAHLLRYPVSGGTPQLSFQKLPPFPSLGCPMFTIGDDQLSASRDIGEDAIKYYFVRDNHSASIVIYSQLTGANSGDYGVQHMSFGVLDCFKISEQFMYPLYVAGGNGALDKEHWVYYYPNSGIPSHDVGNIYNLNMSNTSLSNSNLLLSTKFNGANVTNFRVLCPDGHWDNVFNAVQTCSLIVDPDECYPNAWTPRYYVYNKPEVGGSELGDLRYGGTTLDCGYDNIKKIDTWLINHDYLESPKLSMYTEDITASTPLIPVVPTFSSHKLVSSEMWPRHRYGAIGKIPHCYYSWSRWLKFGELEINGKKFLAIPCAYNNRLWWPETRTSVNLASLESQWEEIRNINNKLSNYMIYDYVLLELEE